MANKVLKYLILLALILFVVSVLSFLWGGRSSFKDQDIVLEIESIEQASVGDEITYRVKYTNNARVTLSDMKFLFFYPDNSVVIENGKVSSAETSSFEVSELHPGQSEVKEFRSFLVGDRGDIKKAKINLSFKAGSIRSSFEKSATASTTIVSVPVSLTLVSPPNAVSGQALTFILDYRNETQGDLSDLRFEFKYPEGFMPQSSLPSPSAGNNVWDVASIKQGAGSRITITGILSGLEGDDKTINLILKRKISDEYVDYERASSTTLIGNPILGLSILGNNSAEYSANLGEEINYEISFQNSSRFNLSGLSLAVKLEGDMYDFDALDTRGGFYDSSTKTIFWNSGSIREFENFAPNIKGRVEFRIRLKSQFTSSAPGTSRDRFVKATAILSTSNVPSEIGTQEISVQSSTVTRISSQPAFNQSIYFNDPNFGSSGVFPPQAGQETTFIVHWQLANPGNDVTKAEVVANLPPGVTWIGPVSTSGTSVQPTFNPNVSQVIWKIESLPFGVGSFAPRYETAFKIKIRPTDSEKGAFIDLIKNAKLSGVDGFTKQTVIISAPNLNTQGVVDSQGGGKVQ